MKTVCKVLLSSLVLLSFSSIAAKDLHNKLIIQAIPSSEGTVVIEGQPKYEKTFNVVVYSVIDQPIELTGDVGCYKAFDEKDKEFDGRLVQAELLGILKDSPKAGEATFVSDDESVYNAKFVNGLRNANLRLSTYKKGIIYKGYMIYKIFYYHIVIM